MSNPRWGYVRIISGTIGGGVLGFYLMHRAELKYKEMWNERLRKYEEELNRRKQIEEANSSNEFPESEFNRDSLFSSLRNIDEQGCE